MENDTRKTLGNSTMITIVGTKEHEGRRTSECGKRDCLDCFGLKTLWP